MAGKKTVAKKTRSRDDIKALLLRAFREEFPDDTVDISDGYKDNVHVLIVSRRFDDLSSEKAKQDMLWNIVDRTVLSDAEKSLISLLMPVSPAEIK